MDQWFMENWYWLTVAAGIIYWAGRISSAVSYLKSDVSTLKTDVGLLKEGLADIKGKLTESFFEDIKTITLWIKGQNKAGSHGAIMKPQSPVALTDYGRALADEIGGAQIAARHVDQADKKTQGMSLYEVQGYCFSHAYDILEQLRRGDPNKYRELSDAAYRHGEAIECFANVIGILLRDAVLAKRGVASGDIDSARQSLSPA